LNFNIFQIYNTIQNKAKSQILQSKIVHF